MEVQRSRKGRVGAVLLGWGIPFGLLFITACYTYAPVIGGPPSPGDDVRVQLAQEPASRISEMTGRSVRSLEGKVFRVEPDSLVLEVGWGAVYAGTILEGRRDTLAFHERELLEIDRRAFSRGRTALVGAALVAAIVFAVRGLSGGGGETDPGTGNGTPF
jgi:hypothetical protein